VSGTPGESRALARELGQLIKAEGKLVDLVFKNADGLGAVALAELDKLINVEQDLVNLLSQEFSSSGSSPGSTSGSDSGSMIGSGSSSGSTSDSGSGSASGAGSGSSCAFGVTGSVRGVIGADFGVLVRPHLHHH
jgi:hypothetical protein